MNNPGLDRIVGILLFLPVPIVLALFTRQPFGVLPSLALGVAIMGTHRLYARPWVVARAKRRCLWCGAAADAGPAIPLREPGGKAAPVPWRACSDAHAVRSLRLLGWAERRRALLRWGILGAIVVLLAGAALASRDLLGPVVPEDAVNAFRLLVAVSVLPLGWLGTRGAVPREAPSSPFPVHIQALVGSWAVVWLFRLIGLWWLAAAVIYFVGRLR